MLGSALRSLSSTAPTPTQEKTTESLEIRAKALRVEMQCKSVVKQVLGEKGLPVSFEDADKAALRIAELMDDEQYYHGWQVIVPTHLETTDNTKASAIGLASVGLPSRIIGPFRIQVSEKDPDGTVIMWRVPGESHSSARVSSEHTQQWSNDTLLLAKETANVAERVSPAASAELMAQAMCKGRPYGAFCVVSKRPFGCSLTPAASCGFVGMGVGDATQDMWQIAATASSTPVAVEPDYTKEMTISGIYALFMTTMSTGACVGAAVLLDRILDASLLTFWFGFLFLGLGLTSAPHVFLNCFGHEMDRQLAPMRKKEYIFKQPGA